MLVPLNAFHMCIDDHTANNVVGEASPLQMLAIGLAGFICSNRPNTIQAGTHSPTTSRQCYDVMHGVLSAVQASWDCLTAVLVVRGTGLVWDISKFRYFGSIRVPYLLPVLDFFVTFD